jgi:hypothetical protein
MTIDLNGVKVVVNTSLIITTDEGENFVVINQQNSIDKNLLISSEKFAYSVHIALTSKMNLLFQSQSIIGTEDTPFV